MQNKTLLILSASVATGHITAAEALHQTAQKLFPQIISIHKDVLPFTNKIFSTCYNKSYVITAKYTPKFWEFLYKKYDKSTKNNLTLRLLSVFEKMFSAKLRYFVKKIKPFHIICTHFLPANLLLSYKHLAPHCPISVLVTDYDVHTMWLNKNVDCYFVSTEEVKNMLTSKGYPPEKIHITGIPVRPLFFEFVDREKIKKSLNLNPSAKTVLVLTGGCGMANVKKMVKHLLSDLPDINLIVLAGTSKSLYDSLYRVRQKFGKNFILLRKVENIHELMEVSDIVITKPGGLTTTECLVKRIPVIAYRPIPGQEEKNCEYAVRAGAAVRIFEEESASEVISNILNDEKKLHEMRENARKAANPNAASLILNTIINNSINTEKIIDQLNDSRIYSSNLL